MPSEPVVPISGVLVGDPEFRYHRDIPVARFRMSHTPQVWNARTQTWQDGEPQRYVCTVWRNVAEHVTESLTDGVAVLVFGRIARVDGEAIHLSVDDIGVSLRDRIAYTEASLPGPQAAAPPSPPPGPAPNPAPAAAERPEQPAGSTPPWWQRERRNGWSGFARTAARATSDPAAFRLT